MRKIRAPFVFALIAFSVAGCAVNFVAEYNAAIQEEIIQTARKVDLFWGELMDTNIGDRQYDNFKDKYNEIETDIRVLLMKNEIRALNEESTKQAKIALDLWMEDRKLHKTNNTFSDFEAQRHRTQYTRIFTAMAKGEEAKNIQNGGDES